MAQTRSFLFIDECIEASRRLMDSDFIGPVNIGSEEMVTINELVETLPSLWEGSKKDSQTGCPLGVRGRNSNNDVVRRELGWDYSQTLEEGIRKTYEWISAQIGNPYRSKTTNYHPMKIDIVRDEVKSLDIDHLKKHLHSILMIGRQQVSVSIDSMHTCPLSLTRPSPF